MKSADVRSKFLKYFEKHDHSIVSSSRLVPENDNTILFTNAGMNQFKNVFLGYDKRDYVRATTSQKCVRAGGKHNDLEQVGITARHHTFFEMLGNFSFGDYFKKDAIHFAWELLIKEYGFPKEKLYITVFETDDEAAEIWHKQESVPKDRIFRYGEKDNFWRMGDTGPCGPCSEIFYDHGVKAGSTGNPNAKFGEDDQRFVEIWNLVFMQFFEEAPGKMSKLPKPSVDTGAGLERLSAALQGVYMNYDTDLFQPLIQKAAELSKKSYNQTQEVDTALRVLADHSRAAAFLICDGVLPTNEGRGYVLRRIMRRAIRYGRKLSTDQSLLSPIVGEVIAQMNKAYPDLNQQKSLILKTVQNEEQSFLQTLDQGTEILNSEIFKIKKQNAKTLSGDFAFKLYDTFGFPMDLTRIMSAEQNILIDESGFESKMEEARKKSQASWKGQAIGTDQGHLIELSQKLKPTEFLGYKTLSSSAKVLALSSGQKAVAALSQGETGLLITDQTPFYAESGGQAGDHGIARGKNLEIEIQDCTKINNMFLHQVSIKKGTLEVGATLDLQVDDSKRRDTVANHSATHLMHAALRKVLGDHVTQAGSLVDADRTRFDFTHDKPLTDEQITTIEKLVNEQIALSHDVNPQVMSYKKAIESGAMALFGEKYGDEVRVLKMGDFSCELCGGTHVANTSQIGLFKIMSEAGVSRGVRRVEAITLGKAKEYAVFKTELENKLAQVSKITQISSDEFEKLQKDFEKVSSDERIQRFKLSKLVSALQDKLKLLGRQVEKQKVNTTNWDYDELVKSAKNIADGKFLFASIPSDNRNVLAEASDKLKDKIQKGIVIVIGEGSDSHPLIVSVTKDLTAKYNAGKILQEITSLLGGKGGGRPDFAQGSVESLDKLEQAKNKIAELF